MAVYLITYDLNRESIRPNITKVIKSFPEWARLSESSYAVSTLLSIDDVYRKIKPLIDSNDNVYVISLHRPYTGFGPPVVNEWLETRLAYAYA